MADQLKREVDRKSEYDDKYETYQMGWQDFLEQACLDQDYALKAQYTKDEVDKANGQERTLYTFDKISRQINLLHGYEIRNRHILKIGPVGGFDQEEDQACTQHTNVTMSDMSRLGGYDILSDAFKWGTLVSGSNLIERWRDRDGRMQFGRLGYSQFLLDSGLTKTDLSDCQDILTGQWISTAKAKMLVPTKTSKIESIEPLSSSSRWDYLTQPALQNKQRQRLFEQWWHRETEEVEMVQSRVDGEKMPFKEFVKKFAQGDKEVAQKIIENFRLPSGVEALVKYTQTMDKIRLTIFLDDVFLWEGDNPTGLRDFNYTWVHGQWCPECTQSGLKLQGFVRGLRDPQKANNRRGNQIIDIIETAVQGMRVVRSKYIRNPEEAYKSGQGAVLQVEDDAPDSLPLNEIFTQKQGSDVPQSLFAAFEMVDKIQSDTGGLGSEILGDDHKDIPGVLHQYRTGQALTGQAWMFQAFRASKRDLGRKQVRLVQINYTKEQIKEILNAEPVEGFFDDNLMKFDCTPTEGLLTDSQRTLYYEELKELLKTFPELFAGVITAEMIVSNAPMQFSVPTLNAIKQAEQAKQQAQQQAQQQQQLDIQLQQALTATQVAQAKEDMADAANKRSQIPLNNAKTISEINKNQAGPLVDILKEYVKMTMANQAQQLQAQNAGQGAA